jgi:predicted nucleic acid-binding protein
LTLSTIVKEKGKVDELYQNRIKKVITLFNGLDKVKSVDQVFRNSAEQRNLATQGLQKVISIINDSITFNEPLLVGE